MQKLIATGALLLAIAAPARAGLTAEENARVVDLIKNRYAPMGLTADEITILVRDLGNRLIGYHTNADGTVTFVYERRDGNVVVELGQVCTVRLAAPAR
ncbi:hypothetical protein E7V67_011325 [[Empedobacter] haloabium]|uniref:Uncharacterized protein n=1 Tax=[Empedobacter] haloabium TaxID=592317 RepID=A0ABZ1UTQ7_9BURK